MSWCFRSLGQGTSVCFQWLEEDGGVGACAADGSHWNGRSLGPWAASLACAKQLWLGPVMVSF